MSKTGLVSFAATLALLTGCKAVGPDFHSPAPPNTAGYQMSGDAAPTEVAMSADARAGGAWWKAFGSNDLDAVVDRALSGNPSLAEANASLARMQELAIVTHAAQLPQVDTNAALESERINLTAFGFTGFPGLNITNPTLGLYTIGGTVSYDLDVFGGLRRATEAARARAEAQARQADAAYLTLTGQTTMAALQIATIRAEIAAAQQTVDEDRQVLDIVHAAQAAGGEAPSASASATAQLAQDEAALPPLRQQLAQSRHALAQLVGQAPAEWAPPDFDLASFNAPTQAPVSLPSALVRRRPDILVAEANLHAATAEIGVATAQLYPDIKLTANLAQTALSPTSLFSYNATGWTLASGVTQPVFHGGALRANRRAAVDAANAALAHYKGTVVAAFTQVADVMSAIAQDDAEIAAQTRAQGAAAAAVHDDEIAYKLGGGALLPVLDDERRLQAARRTLVMAEGRRLADVAQLYVATAADWREAKS
ncbi:MAG TPA: efflux transporter outer membrane subunit [Caulobacteraceae bacterium]|nr:efflux transporter outer membrane subunit [Caulobacteraceae bacterium]